MRSKVIERVAPPVNHEWERNETWLAQNTPEVLDALAPGATVAEIAVIERLIKTELPVDFYASYLRHNGMIGGDARGLFGGKCFMPLAQIADSYLWWRTTATTYASELPFTTSSYFWVRPELGNPLWVPFGLQSEADGTMWYLDLDPLPDGNRGQILDVCLSLRSSSRVEISFLDWLQKFAEELEAGMFVPSDKEAGTIAYYSDTYAYWRSL